MMKSISLLLSVSLFSSVTYAKFCPVWNNPQIIGQLDSKILPETSGVVVSQQFPNRLYHMNDSGNKKNLFLTEMTGKLTEQILVPGLSSSSDVEEISYGPCQNKKCLFIGNIGDNSKNRSSIEFVWFEEKQSYKNTRLATKSLKMKYPDGPHNAEAFFIHPNGDIYLFTKETDSPGTVAKPALIFRAPARALNSTKATFVLEKIGEIDLAYLLPGISKKLQTVTGASISPDGQSFLLLTYSRVFEIAWDFKSNLLNTNLWIEGIDFSQIALNLPQQEAVTYLNDALGFIVTSENISGSFTPFAQVNCR